MLSLGTTTTPNIFKSTIKLKEYDSANENGNFQNQQETYATDIFIT